MEEIRLSKKEIQNRLNNMRIQPDNFTLRKYQVSVKYFSDNEESPSKRIDYEVTADLNIEDGKGILTINKENVFYNQHNPDLINEVIANTILKSTYPIKTHLNEKGISSNEILNHTEIIERWNHEKKLLGEKYSSSDLETFFNTFEQKLSHKEKLEKNLQYDWFWNLFFHPKLINYGERRTAEGNLLLSVIPYHNPLQFPGIQKIEKIPTKYHSFVVHFESRELPAPSYFKNQSHDLSLFMSLNVTFDIDLYHHFPMHIEAEFEVYSKDRLGNKIPARKVLFSMYQVNSDEYKAKTLDRSSPFITGGLVKLPPNKWGFDNFERIENDW
ncbi:hypothetical protein [Chryseobacterium sp.]|uniref:hypothetical protein n=1 Tax=Chryseobacterium sp. TaxID=1871047 RepID=UPI003218FBEB